MSIEDKLVTVATNHRMIATQYFKTSFIGDGTKKVSIPMPFKPDMIDIVGVSGSVDAVKNNFYTLSFDTRSAGIYSGKYGYCQNTGAMGNGMMRTASVLASISYADGVFTWNAPALPALWSNLIRYSVMAVKFPENTTRQMVEEDIRLLPNTVPSGCSGTLSYNTAQINDTFTSEEWAALTGTKPNWTFVLS